MTSSVRYTDAPWSPITLPSYPFLGDTTQDFGEHIAGEMSVTHNVIIRCMNSIWINAPLVQSAEAIDDFTGYALVTLQMLDAHHDMEETVMFPALEGKLDMQENIEQHKVFMDAMEEFESYLKSVRSGGDVYDAEKMRALLKAFVDPLFHHLNEEITTITPDVMKRVDPDILGKVAADITSYFKRQGGLFTTLPCLLTAHKAEDAPNWPRVPAVLRWLTTNAFYRIYSGYWTFAPYSTSGEPQEYSVV